MQLSKCVPNGHLTFRTSVLNGGDVPVGLHHANRRVTQLVSEL